MKTNFTIGTSLLLLIGLACSSPSSEPSSRNDSSFIELDFYKLNVTQKQAPPSYPEKAKSARIEGVVVVEIKISTEGVPTSAKAISGPEELREASEAYSMTWRFRPVIVDGTARTVKTRITYPFRLPR